jgi:ribosome-associated protein
MQQLERIRSVPTPVFLESFHPPSLEQFIIHHLEEGKASDIKLVSLPFDSGLADSLIIATGSSRRQLNALADRLEEALKLEGRMVLSVEGKHHADWVVIDCGDTMVHLFTPEMRMFYHLEKLWG